METFGRNCPDFFPSDTETNKQKIESPLFRGTERITDAQSTVLEVPEGTNVVWEWAFFFLGSACLGWLVIAQMRLR